MMCAPLVDSDGQVLGVIQIDTTDQRRQFNKDDLEVLVSVASHAAMAMENVQLHERRLHAELMERELALAHKVQRGLLPAGPPVVKGYEFVDLYEPANHLGGDYFDYIGLPGGRLAIALADVMGKGIAAALLMARLSAQVPYCLASLPTPADAMARLNTVFCEPRWEGLRDPGNAVARSRAAPGDGRQRRAPLPAIAPRDGPDRGSRQRGRRLPLGHRQRCNVQPVYDRIGRENR